MKITMEKNDKALTVRLDGRLDTESAPELEEALTGVLSEAETLTFDLADTEYVSSAGLRVLVKARKRMPYKGEMKVINANELVREVFSVTGLDELLGAE